MLVPLLSNTRYVNKFTKYSLYDTDTFTVSIITYKELMSMYQDKDEKTIVKSCSKSLISWYNKTFPDKFVRISDNIYMYITDTATYFYKDTKLYITASIGYSDYAIPILINNKLGLFGKLEEPYFISRCYESKEEIQISKLKRSVLLDKDYFQKVQFRLNMGALVTSPVQGVDFGNYGSTLETLAVLDMSCELLPQNKNVWYMENTKENGLKFAYIGVEDSIYCIRNIDYPKTIFTYIQTDKNGMTDMPLHTFTRLKYTDVVEVMQMIALGTDEEELLIGGIDCTSINLGVPNLRFVVS